MNIHPVARECAERATGVKASETYPGTFIGDNLILEYREDKTWMSWFKPQQLWGDNRGSDEEFIAWAAELIAGKPLHAALLQKSTEKKEQPNSLFLFHSQKKFAGGMAIVTAQTKEEALEQLNKGQTNYCQWGVGKVLSREEINEILTNSEPQVIDQQWYGE